jgi:hypothetical protein
MPASGPEREAALRCLAFDLATQLGLTTARYLAALVDEMADELSLGDGAVHAKALQERSAP